MTLAAARYSTKAAKVQTDRWGNVLQDRKQDADNRGRTERRGSKDERIAKEGEDDGLCSSRPALRAGATRAPIVAVLSDWAREHGAAGIAEPASRHRCLSARREVTSSAMGGSGPGGWLGGLGDLFERGRAHDHEDAARADAAQADAARADATRAGGTLPAVAQEEGAAGGHRRPARSSLTSHLELDDGFEEGGRVDGDEEGGQAERDEEEELDEGWVGSDRPVGAPAPADTPVSPVGSASFAMDAPEREAKAGTERAVIKAADTVNGLTKAANTVNGHSWRATPKLASKLKSVRGRSPRRAGDRGAPKGSSSSPFQRGSSPFQRGAGHGASGGGGGVGGGGQGPGARVGGGGAPPRGGRGSSAAAAARKRPPTRWLGTAQGGQAQLQAVLAANHSSVRSWFRQWDSSGDGRVDRREFLDAIEQMGYDAPAEVIHALFESFDESGNGTIEYEEMHRLLRQRHELQPELQPGGAGELASLKGTPSRLRSRSAEMSAASERAATAPRLPLAAQALQEDLYQSLVRGHSRVLDLFRRWDGDCSGMVDKIEFRRAMTSLGYDEVGEAAIDSLFDSFDDSANGTIEYEEMYTVLRQRCELQAKGKPSARPKSPKAKHKPRGGGSVKPPAVKSHLAHATRE